jgi:hypothetical protein
VTEEIYRAVKLLLVLLLNSMLFVHLIKLVEKVTESFLESLIILLRKGLFIDVFKDLILLVHKGRQALIISYFRQRSVMILFCINLPENVLKDNLGLLNERICT